MKIIDGKQVAAKIAAALEQEVKALKKEQDITPGLAVVIVGEDPASQIYVGKKEKACHKHGLHSELYPLAESTTEDQLLELIDGLNRKSEIHGILVQLPLPGHIDEMKVLERISPEKDVDGFHPVNAGKLSIGQKAFIPCTPHGMMKLLEEEGIDPAGKHAVVVGRSNIVGKPMANLLLQKNATVTICHSKTRELKRITQQADILVAAVGKPNFITADMVKPGAVVLDVGISRVDGRLVGDVEFEGAKEVAGCITPVPGGVGPMTIIMLLYNTVAAAKNIKGVSK